MEVKIKTLWDTSELMKSVLVHVERLTRGIKGECTDPLEKIGLEHEPDCLIEDMQRLREAFTQSYELMRDNWKSIENNRVWMTEINEFAGKFREFCTAVLDFDDLCIESPDMADEVINDFDISPSLVLLAGEFDKMFKAPFKYAEEGLPEVSPKPTPLQGLCADMKEYFSGLTDKDLEDVIIRNVFCGVKGHWNGAITQGTYFGQHFGITAERMNRLFIFYGEDNQPTKVHYTRYPAKNIRPTDHIAVTLAKYPHREK